MKECQVLHTCAGNSKKVQHLSVRLGERVHWIGGTGYLHIFFILNICLFLFHAHGFVISIRYGQPGIIHPFKHLRKQSPHQRSDRRHSKMIQHTGRRRKSHQPLSYPSQTIGIPTSVSARNILTSSRD